MEFCPHCMRPASGATCKNCGGQMNWTAQFGQLPVGTLLMGAEGHAYQIGAARGQGGFGITYAAMDLNTAKRVAIKEYYPTRCAQRTQFNQVTPMTGQDSSYSSGMKSFLEEAMMLSAVGALPSVVTVHDFFEANGTAYLVMEFVDGVPLHEIVNARGRMPAEELMPKLSALMKDLDILHRAGIIHRDISPDNLILMPNGNLKLLDFGSARSMQTSKSMTVLLKAGFSPVEQHKSTGQGPWTDVYALAATIYYCLTGEIPEPASDRLDHDNLKKPTALGARLTAAQEKALLWGLAVQPMKRPQTMELFRQKLFAAPRSEPIGPRPEPVGPKPMPQPPVSDHTTEDISTRRQNVNGGTESLTGRSTKPADTGTQSLGGRTDWTMDDSNAETEVLRPEDLNNMVTTPDIPAPPPKKKGVNKWVVIGAAAAAAVVALVLIIVGVINAGRHGTTSDGFVYELVSKDHAVITDYTGSGGEITIPNRIEGLPVRYLEDDAFDGCSLTTVTVSLDVIPQGNPFEGCGSLHTFIFSAGSGNNSSAYNFSALGGLRCILFPSEAASQQSNLSGLSNVVICHVGQMTDFGAIRFVTVQGNVVYGMTDAMCAVVMELPEGVDGDTLPTAIGNYEVRLPDGRVPGQQDYIAGETDDGFLYAISEDGSECIVTGYTGAKHYPRVPSEIDGATVKVIGEGAFAGLENLESIFLPSDLERIEALAFENCTGLRDIYVYSECTAAPDIFSGCSQLHCGVYSEDASLKGPRMPADFITYTLGMETEVGQLALVYVMDDNVIYGATVEDRCLVMDIPASAEKITLVEQIEGLAVETIHEDALDGVSEETVIYLPPELLFPAYMWNWADWQFLESEDQFTLAENWWYTCCLMAEINENRGSVKIQVDPDLTRAAALRAEELVQSNTFERPDGSKWSTVLDDYGIDWSYASMWKDTVTGENGEDIVTVFTEIVAEYAAPEPEHDNAYYDQIGVGMYYDNGTYYIVALAVIGE